MGVVAGIVAYIVALAINWVGSGGLAWYDATPWLWKPPGTEPMLYVGLAHLLLGVFLALAFESLEKGLVYRGATRGAWLGYLVWLVGSLPGIIITWATMSVPDPLIATWALAGLVSYIAAGSIVGVGLGDSAAGAARRPARRGRRR